MVYYLKYRPQKIKELDSLDVREKLESVLKGKLPDKISHAFLFTGPKGLGKTSAARILAKAINCTNRKRLDIEPCNRCSSCTSIMNGSNLDVLEIDGASNRGIDEIRDLREKIRLSPVASLKKIYIIDEVHMLTAEAFNALLKTLEEPPSHAFFVLCTTEPQKLPETITSRCFHIKFERATHEDLSSSFQRIAKGEGLKIDKGALLEIARLSDGSFRDGAKILEELSLHTSNISLSLIEKKYKTRTTTQRISELILSFERYDAKSGIEIVSALSQEDVDFKFFMEKLIEKLHQNLILQAMGEKFEMNIEQTKNLIELLVKAHMSIRYAVLPQLPLELAIVEWASDESRIKNQELREDKSLLSNSKTSQNSDASKKPSTNSLENDKILESLIEKAKKENFSIAGVLRGCKVEKFDKGELVLSTRFKFHKEKLSDKKVVEMLEKLSSEIAGEKVKVLVV